MYVPEFFCGAIVGAVIGMTLIVVIALCASKDDKDEK